MLKFLAKWSLFCYRSCMGLSNSRQMEEAELFSDENTDSEAELDTILGLLIRSGQMRLLGVDQSMNLINSYGPEIPAESNMQHFQENDIAQETRKASGERPSTISRMKTLPDMLIKREIGMDRGVSFSRSQKCRINNLKIPSLMRVIDSYDHKAFCGIYSQDGKKLLTACQDRQMRVYDVCEGRTFKVIHTIPGRDVGWSILDVAFSPDTQSIAYTSWSSNIHIIDLGGDTTVHQALPLCPEERRFCIFCIQFSSDGREILCGANDGHMYIYDRNAAYNYIYRVEAHADDVNAVSFADETSQIIYSGADDGLCKVWDRRTLNERMPKPVGVLAGHLDGITYIDSRGDARYFISNSKDQSIKLWDIRMFSSSDAQVDYTKKVLGNQKWDYRWQEAPRDYIQGKKSIKGDTSVATYKGHQVLQTLIRCHFSPAFSTGQRYIYTGDAYGKVLVYDVLTGKIMTKLAGHTSCVRDVSWHPYRPEIISTSWDYTVICWSHTGLNATEPHLKKTRGRYHEQPNNNEGPRRSQRLASHRLCIGPLS